MMNNGVTNPDTFIVHKEGDEGTLSVNRLTGQIVTPLDDRPDWAEGLTTALVQERVTHYEKRLGRESQAFKDLTDINNAVEFSDLGWLGVSADQTELEISADPEYRSEVIAKALGIDTETGEMSQKAMAEREVSRHQEPMSHQEHKALEDSVTTGFTGDHERQQDRQAASGSR